MASYALLGALVLAAAAPGLAWGPEGHKAVVILARRYMRPQTMEQVQGLLGSESMEDASLWADQIAHSSRPGTAPWHYIDIPLRDSRIDLRRECPDGQCVVAKTQEFLAQLSDRQASREAKREALKFVIHFVADLHQPLHCEDHNDKGGNLQHVIFEGHPDNLHWVWDTGLVQQISRNPQDLAAGLARKVTDGDRAAWEQGTVADWAIESHGVAQNAAYRRLWLLGPPRLDRAYDQRAQSAITMQIERAAVRLACVLNKSLSGPDS